MLIVSSLHSVTYPGYSTVPGIIKCIDHWWRIRPATPDFQFDVSGYLRVMICRLEGCESFAYPFLPGNKGPPP